MTSQPSTWKIKVFAEDGTRLNPLKPRRARLLVDAGLAKASDGPDGKKVITLLPNGVDFIRSGASFESLKGTAQSQSRALQSA